MSIEIVLFLFGVGIIGGMITAVAGGSTLITLPALIATGLPPLIANTSNFVGIFPGNAAAILAYRRELTHVKAVLPISILVSCAGGGCGALLLLWTGEEAFSKLVPYLMLLATLIFAFDGPIKRIVSRLPTGADARTSPTSLIILFLFMTYGGFFGVGLGVAMLAILLIIGYEDIHQANGVKNLLLSFVTLIGIFVYSASGLISWPEALSMMGGTAIGGYLGGRWARHIPIKWLRRAIITFSLSVTTYYFLTITFDLPLS